MLRDVQGRNSETNNYFHAPSKLLKKKHTGWALMISPSLGIHYTISGDIPALGYLAWASTLLTGVLFLCEEAAIPKGLYSTLALQLPDQKSFHINWKILPVVESAWVLTFFLLLYPF